MNQTHGKLIAEFDTKLSNVLLSRILTLPVLASLAVAASFIYFWITDDNAENAATGRLLLFIGAALLIIIYFLFFKRIYKAEIYEQGLVLTDKRSRKVKNLSFAEINNVREIMWTHRYGFIPFFKRREFEINVKSEMRVISIDGKSMMNIKAFSSTLTDTFNIYRSARV